MATAREEGRADSTEKLLQPEIPGEPVKPAAVTTMSSNSGYFSDTEGGGNSGGSSSAGPSAPGADNTECDGAGGKGSLDSASCSGTPLSSRAAGQSSSTSGGLTISGGGLGTSTPQSRNRIPLGLCVQQTAISTPSASISVDEPPIMISTDDDPDNVQVLLGRPNSYERHSIDSSSHTIHDVELTLGTGSASHSLHSSSAMMGGSSSAFGRGDSSSGGGGVHFERGGSFPGNPHLHDPSCKHR